jgi:hypothetical protein
MKTLLNLTLLLLLAAPLTAPAKDAAAGKPKEKISDFAAFKIPAGWTASERVEQGDPQLSLANGLHIINIRLAGGAASRYRSPGEFLIGFEARSTGGKTAEKAEAVVVSGARVLLYRRKIPVSMPPPDESGPSTMTTEEFCAVPAGKRFFILTYSYGDTIPDPSYDGDKVWREFLKEFRALKKR